MGQIVLRLCPYGSFCVQDALFLSEASSSWNVILPVYFLLIEDEWGLLQCTIFEKLYRDSGSLLYQTGAFLLDGRVEQHPRRGFSFVVERIADLAAALNEVGDRPKRVPREAALPDSGERAPRTKGRRKAG